jgi:hypothetical protein
MAVAMPPMIVFSAKRTGDHRDAIDEADVLGPEGAADTCERGRGGHGHDLEAAARDAESLCGVFVFPHTGQPIA